MIGGANMMVLKTTCRNCEVNMEITMEEEVLNSNFEFKKMHKPKVIKVYPYEDEAIHITYIVKEENFDRAYRLLSSEYDNWNTNCWEEDWDFDDLERFCDDALEYEKIFKIKFLYSDEASDMFSVDEIIG